MTTLQRQIDRLLAHRASEWHQIMENPTPSDKAEFVRWLKKSPVHVQEYLATACTDELLESLDPNKEEDVEALIAQLTATRTVASIAPAPEKPQKRFFSPRALAVSAAIAAAAAVLGAVLLPSAWVHDYSTGLGEQRTIQLPDASIVTLNVDSKIDVQITRERRAIHVIRGDAFFDVAPDHTRPFVVNTEGGSVTALGTQFNVHKESAATRVSVLEGHVQLNSSQRQFASGTVPVLAAGDEGQILSMGAVSRSEHPDIPRSTAWRDRLLIFDNTPLEDVIAEFNHYNAATQMVLADIPVKTYRYTGIFNAMDPQSLIALLDAEKDFRSDHRGDEIVIRLAASAPAGG